MNEDRPSTTHLVTLVRRAKAAVAPLRDVDDEVAKATIEQWDRMTDDYVADSLATRAAVPPHRLATIESLVNELEVHPAVKNLIDVSSLMFSALPDDITVDWIPPKSNPVPPRAVPKTRPT